MTNHRSIVELDARFYSVPHRYVRERVEVRATATTVEIFHSNQRIASHLREYGKRRYITDPAHRPASHREYLEWSPSRLVRWGQSIAPEVGAMIEKILARHAHPEHGFRQCVGITSLAKRHGSERVAAACRRALALNAISYTSVKSILTKNLDRLPIPDDELPIPAPPAHHENLRGAAAFAMEA